MYVLLMTLLIGGGFVFLVAFSNYSSVQIVILVPIASTHRSTGGIRKVLFTIYFLLVEFRLHTSYSQRTFFQPLVLASLFVCASFPLSCLIYFLYLIENIYICVPIKEKGNSKQFSRLMQFCITPNKISKFISKIWFFFIKQISKLIPNSSQIIAREALARNYRAFIF